MVVDSSAIVAHAAATGETYASHLWHPFFIEGLKTLAFEIAEQLGWEVPDAVVVGVGDGCIIGGLHKGFRDLHALGWIDRMPRLLGAQAAGSDFLFQA